MYTYISNKANVEVHLSGHIEEDQIKVETVEIDGQTFERHSFPMGLVLEYGSTSDGRQIVRSNRQLIETTDGYYLDSYM